MGEKELSDEVCRRGGVSSKEDESEGFSRGEQWRVKEDRWVEQVGGIEGQR